MLYAVVNNGNGRSMQPISGNNQAATTMPAATQKKQGCGCKNKERAMIQMYQRAVLIQWLQIILYTLMLVYTVRLINNK